MNFFIGFFGALIILFGLFILTTVPMNSANKFKYFITLLAGIAFLVLGIEILFGSIVAIFLSILAFTLYTALNAYYAYKNNDFNIAICYVIVVTIIIISLILRFWLG